MSGQRVQRQVTRLLDEIDAALTSREWERVRALSLDVLALQPENEDAKAFLSAADARLAGESWRPASGATPLPGTSEGLVPAPDVIAPAPSEGDPSTGSSVPVRIGIRTASGQRVQGVGETRRHSAAAGAAHSQPASFADGRYVVKKFLGEGGKKKVYLAHDTVLDRDVAFALIKTEGLDEASRTRITREAQAMGRLGTHPNIVTVFDFGDIDGLRPALAPPLPATVLLR